MYEKSTHCSNYFLFTYIQGQLKLWNQDGSGSPQRSSDPQQEVTDGQVRAVWQELGVGAVGSLNREELSLVCDHIGLKDLQPGVRSCNVMYEEGLVIILTKLEHSVLLVCY